MILLVTVSEKVFALPPLHSNSRSHTQHATNSTWLDKGAGILTRFPFDGREAGYESPGLGGARRFPLVILGPPYPQLTAISVEPFPTSVLNNSVE